MYFNAGQACNAASRLFVHAKEFDEVVGRLSSQAAKTVPGPGLDPATFIGPLVSSTQRQRVLGFIDRARGQADLVAGGQSDAGSGGYFVEPTLFITDDDSLELVRSEIFGPVLVAQRYQTLEEVAERANISEYGLAAGVWTNDLATAHRFARLLTAGTVYINTWGQVDSAAPFGGFKTSGIGREHGAEGLDAYLETKTVFTRL
jgi:acyl-CoA reductase-like NAD-dependent aldehyde dehydrogenase